MIDLRNIPLLCADHIRRLGRIFRSRLPEVEKEGAFEVGLRETSDCLNCLTRRGGEPLPRVMKVKICVVGDMSAEKALILSPFVHPAFDDRYIQTLGTQVSKKELVIPSPIGSDQIRVDMMIWNILGNKGFRELLKEAFFYGSRGALCIADGTRPDGLDGIDDWIGSVFGVTGRIPLFILVNTKGQPDKVIEEAAVAAKSRAYQAPCFYTSTDTGANVESAFHTLAERIVAERFQSDRAPGEG